MEVQCCWMDPAWSSAADAGFAPEQGCQIYAVAGSILAPQLGRTNRLIGKGRSDRRHPGGELGRASDRTRAGGQQSTRMIFGAAAVEAGLGPAYPNRSRTGSPVEKVPRARRGWQANEQCCRV